MSAISKLFPVIRNRTLFILENRLFYDSNKPLCLLTRSYSRTQQSNTLTRPKPQSDVSSDVKPIGERVKENTKTASYMGVIVVGVAVTGFMIFAIFRELLSSKSPNGVYSAALEKCLKDYRIEDSLGAPVKAFGEETRRGRRGHVAHTGFIRDGVPHMRMLFHLKGSRNRAEVQLEVRENSSGDWEYRYLFAQLEDYPRTTIIIEDNRIADPVPSPKLQGFM